VAVAEVLFMSLVAVVLVEQFFQRLQREVLRQSWLEMVVLVRLMDSVKTGRTGRTLLFLD
jgi:hypothetical protein